MRDRELVFRIMGMVSLFLTMAGLLLVMGIATGMLIFKRIEAPTLGSAGDGWRESLRAAGNGEAAP